jgi:hypothetical protein
MADARGGAKQPIFKALYPCHIRTKSERCTDLDQITAAWARVMPKACLRHDDARRPSALIPRGQNVDKAPKPPVSILCQAANTSVLNLTQGSVMRGEGQRCGTFSPPQYQSQSRATTGRGAAISRLGYAFYVRQIRE